ncbi:u2 snrnp auxiliary factor small subunit [Holotrichia oblita]|uniref:U2 snrnp auxiliary factor small subunit n=1 Tax=Holotrichia oblita TaxID=644536 RepID=A0ACB9T2J8_HOLOL|nr:u2 snrnp auxiliary factor small subunit [Holotrichia oblita]
MAEYLASIFGTEKDKVNCSFYFKIGACRHGDRCSRIHNKPTFSQTCLLQNLYVNPQNSAKSADGSHLVANVSDEEMQEHYDNFFEDVFVECEDKYGEIEEMNVCDNLGDHLVGNVYIKFRREEDAERAVNDLNNRWFGGRPVYAELSPVTDFREACCRQYEMGECTRSGFYIFILVEKQAVGDHDQGPREGVPEKDVLVQDHPDIVQDVVEDTELYYAFITIKYNPNCLSIYLVKFHLELTSACLSPSARLSSDPFSAIVAPPSGFETT